MASQDGGGPGHGAVVARGLDHVAVNVSDLPGAVSFFVSTFGARVVFEIARVDGAAAMARLGADAGASFALAMLEFGDARLELLEWSPAGEDGGLGREWPPAAALGVAHVAITVDDLPSTLQALRAVDGVAIVGEPVTFPQGPTPGLANAFATAPFGLLIELMCWTQGRV